MAGKSGVDKLLTFVTWLTGVIVALAVAFAMTDGTLVVPYIPSVVSVIAGWVVVVTTILGVILAIVRAFK